MNKTNLVQTILVDTFNRIQDAQLIAESKKPKGIDRDDWKDFGIDMSSFLDSLQELGFLLVFVLGEPGTGKSFGIKTLVPKEYVWFNADDKVHTWEVLSEYKDDFKKFYGGSRKIGPLQIRPKTYGEITKACTQLKKGIKIGDEEFKLAEYPIAFLIGHTMTYNSPEGVKVCAKTLGKMATKIGIESRSAYTFYTEMKTEITGKPKFGLATKNSGMNTCRSVEGAFPDWIPNDLQAIRKRIEEID